MVMLKILTTPPIKNDKVITARDCCPANELLENLIF
jgi:hypothetical protein